MNKSLLLIDDDALVAKVYKTKFTNEGFDVFVAATGELALKVLRETTPAVVLLDLQLPDISGIDVLYQIRGQLAFEHLPVIVFSSTYLSSTIQSAWKAGATKVISKANCTPKQLVAIVQRVLAPAEPGPTPIPSTPTATWEPPPAVSLETVNIDQRQEFLAGLPTTLAMLRSRVQMLSKCQDEQERHRCLEELHRQMHSVTSNAGVTGLAHIAQLSEGLEALLKELFDKPKHFTPSTLRTVALTTDFLGALFTHGEFSEEQTRASLNILVVDDEPISRRAIMYTLEKAKLKAVCVDDPQTAHSLLLDNYFDLIFLDVDMPGMTGFELCAKIRKLPRYARTPVVFVTSLSDFESRAKSMISGGSDLIAKPFLFVELAVKALVYVLRSRMAVAKPTGDAPEAVG